jgi:hypothetical protein
MVRGRVIETLSPDWKSGIITVRPAPQEYLNVSSVAFFLEWLLATKPLYALIPQGAR